MKRFVPTAILCVLVTAACGGGASTDASRPPGSAAAPTPTSRASTPSTSAPFTTASPTPATNGCRGSVMRTPPPPGPAPAAASGLSIPSGLRIQVIAKVPNGPRELSFAPNGDLFIGTDHSTIYLVSNAEDAPASPRVYATLSDSPAAGVAVSMKNCYVYVGTQFRVFRIPYVLGDTSARPPQKIASVRPDGAGDHSTTTVAVSGSTLYASVGSSCNACTETDPTRATIEQMGLDGSGMTPKAVHIRNAIALTVNPATNALWAGDAGQDALPAGHPYEFFDDVTAHPGVVNYGWPACEEDHIAYQRGANCTSQAVPRVEFPAYETIVGAVFYDPPANAAHELPTQYRGGVFVTMHGSWHTNASGIPVSPPRVAFVPMSGDVPKTAVDWSTPTKQWTQFVGGFQRADGSRIGRPTGVAVGPEGSLFIADDQTGNIYRVRP